MTLSRRSTIKAIGVVGTGSALSGTALAVNEHQDDERDADEVSDDEEVGAIRVGHFSPDAPNVDVYVDDQQILSDVGYDELSPYLEIVPGTYTISITAAGDDEPIYERTIAVDAEFYTAAAIGELEGESGTAGDDAGLEANASEDGGASENDSDSGFGAADNGTDGEDAGFGNGDNETDDGDSGFGFDGEDPLENDSATDETETEGDLESEAETETGTFEVLLLVDSQTDDVEEGTAPLRFVHAVPDAPAVDIADGETGATIFEDVGFTEPSGYVPVEPGTRTIELFPADEGDLGGETEDGDGNESDGNESDATADDTDVISQPDPVAAVELELEADTAYTAFAIGYLEQQDDAELSVDQDEYATDDDEFGADEAGSGNESSEDDGAAADAAESDDQSEPAADERPFSVRVAVDGEMRDGDEADADDEPGVEDDELEPDEGSQQAANESTDEESADNEELANSTANDSSEPTDDRNATDEYSTDNSTAADD